MEISVRTNYQNGPQQLKQQQSIICNAQQINIHEIENNSNEKKKSNGRKQMFFMTFNVTLKSQMQAYDIWLKC